MESSLMISSLIHKDFNMRGNTWRHNFQFWMVAMDKIETEDKGIIRVGQRFYLLVPIGLVQFFLTFYVGRKILANQKVIPLPEALIVF